LKPKICLTVKQQLEHWTQLYLQARTDGDKKQTKIYEALIIKLGGKVPKI
jgi:hypothetical protein